MLEKLSAIKSNKKIVLLTMASILLVLSVAIPATYAERTDPRVIGFGTGTYRNCSPLSTGFSASIAFSARMSRNGVWSGTWTVTNKTGATQSSGTVTSGALTDHMSYFLNGPETSGCAAPGMAAIAGNCGTGVTILFATGNPFGEHGNFTGNVKCV